jgi:hypothetical protein
VRYYRHHHCHEPPAHAAAFAIGFLLPFVILICYRFDRRTVGDSTTFLQPPCCAFCSLRKSILHSDCQRSDIALVFCFDRLACHIFFREHARIPRQYKRNKLLACSITSSRCRKIRSTITSRTRCVCSDDGTIILVRNGAESSKSPFCQTLPCF